MQRRLVNGEDEEVIRQINRIRAATDLGDLETLTDLATKILEQKDAVLPLVDRALGLALLGQEQYQQAAELLTRYVEFRLPDDRSQPFCSDVQAVQQLAIALSGAGQIVDAVTRLRELPLALVEDPLTQGILAGRFKRQWLKSKNSSFLGQRTLSLYKAAFEKAKALGNSQQTSYNGINAAYMALALGDANSTTLASEVLQICQNDPAPDYWTDVTRAEAHLLLGHYQDALTAYKAARERDHQQREWSSSGQQARDIIMRQGNPSPAAEILALFQGILQDY
jgi:tetratricopeptide (TPR) repeat protein